MKVLVLYHPESDHGGQVEDFAHEYKRFKGKELELLSLETVEGAEMAKLYDVVQYPAVLAVAGDGQLQKLWQGQTLPLMAEIDQYARQDVQEPL